MGNPARDALKSGRNRFRSRDARRARDRRQAEYMGKLVRFGVSLDEDLLEPFDALCARKSYSNRSEAIRDLIRKALADRTAAYHDGILFPQPSLFETADYLLHSSPGGRQKG